MSASLQLPASIRLFRWFLIHFVYRVRTNGMENLPAEGGVLLVPNHLSYVDAVVLQLACPRPIRFVIFQNIYLLKWLNPIFRWVQAIPISDTRAKDGIKLAAEKLQAGEIVCIFPEGELSRSGTLLKLKKGFELVARRGNQPVVPVWLDQLWGSIFSFKGGRYFFKWPSEFPYTVAVSFDQPIPAEKADIALVRERLQILGAEAYERRPELESHLGRACIAGLRKNRRSTALIDGTDHSKMSRGMLLAASIALSRLLLRTVPEQRVAIILPPGKGAVIANLAVVLANKVPVNLNLTAGRSSLESAIARGELKTALSAQIVRRKFPQIPWPENVIALEEVLPPLKMKITAWRIIVAVCPNWLLSKCLGLPANGDHGEAILLFTSGSAGEPKGVVLSHRNILANVAQFGSMLDLSAKDSIMASLPFFHSFGCTVTLWYPIIEGFCAVTYPSPLETVKNIELIEKYGVTVLCSTPTFLRGFLRKAQPPQLKSLRLLVTGAEKLPEDLAKAFKETLGISILQGYGLTETSPAVSTNLPDPQSPNPEYSIQPSNRFGSVGKLLPGQAARITDPDSGQPLSLHQTGMLWLKGANIFGGYLNDPGKTAEALIDGWFRTGDLGRMDEDGFLFIEGRLSRFSKIGGEMVPHETVEAAVCKALEIEIAGERKIAIGSIPDESKGEALVLLTTIPIEAATLRQKLNQNGIPNLWIPKIIHAVEVIPVLPTGKLDLASVKTLCQAAV